ILAIPSTGPGYLRESEVVVLGDASFQTRAIPDMGIYWLSAPDRAESLVAAAAPMVVGPVYLDEIPNDDWIKGTPDTVAEIDAAVIDAAVASGELSVFGGPGSGPRPGVQSPWYHRGSKAKPSLSRLFSEEDETERRILAQKIYGGAFGGRPGHSALASVVVDTEKVTLGDGPGIRVTGKVISDQGDGVGYYIRTIKAPPGEAPYVSHDNFGLDGRMQGQGFGTAFNANAEEWYRENGIDRIELFAATNFDNVGGSVVWAKAGYDWNSDAPSNPETMSKIKTHLESPLDGGPPTAAEKALADQFDSDDPPTPYELLQADRGLYILRQTPWSGVKYLRDTEGLALVADATEDDRRWFLAEVAAGWDHEGEEVAMLGEGADEIVDGAVVAGGPGSGPRPGHKSSWYERGSKKAPITGLGYPAVVDQSGEGSARYRYSDELVADLDASRAHWEDAVGYTKDEIEAGDGRAELKQSSVEDVGARMGDDPEFREWVDDRVPGLSDSEMTGLAQMLAQEHIDQWANSAADHDMRSHALQRAARDVFGIQGDPHVPFDPPGRTIGNFMRQVDDIYALDGPSMRSFVRAQYAETQAQLRGAGVTEMTLVRGTVAESSKVSDAPTGPIPVEMNPMSSWSTDPSIAHFFASPMERGEVGTVWVAKVPAARIVSLPSSGAGCASEYEVIVMGGDGTASSFPSDHLQTEWPGVEFFPGMSVEGFALAPVYLDEPPNDDWPKRTPDTFADLGLDAADEIDAVVAGGPGSGPRPGVQSSWYRRGSKKAPIKSPDYVVVAHKPPNTSDTLQFTGEAKAALKSSKDDWLQLAGFEEQEIRDDWQSKAGGPREQLKEQATAAVADRIHNDPEFQEWAKNETAIRDTEDGEKAPRGVSERLAAEYIDSWASSAADSSARAHALQRAARDVFGLPEGAHVPKSTRLLSLAEVDDIYAAEGPGMRAFLRATYGETQAQLRKAGVTEMTLTRGTRSMGQSFREPESRDIEMNPMSSWSADPGEAEVFGVDGYMWVSTIPAARIVSLPPSGPGCASEFEVVVMGGSGTAVGIPSDRMAGWLLNAARLASGSPSASRGSRYRDGDPTGPVYLDEPPNDDWPKRTPDTMADLGLDGPPSVEMSAIGRFVAAIRAMATGVYGGPGSGPRPGVDSPWYHRGSRLGFEGYEPKVMKAFNGSFSGKPYRYWASEFAHVAEIRTAAEVILGQEPLEVNRRIEGTNTGAMDALSSGDLSDDSNPDVVEARKMADMALTLLSQLGDSGTTGKIYRGLSLTQEDRVGFDAAHATGSEFDLSLASMTDSEDMAMTFASTSKRSGTQPVIMEIASGSRAFEASNNAME
ncbi:MAG TPA: hypothetical protein VMX12_10885, partial [Acidimicrobiia bacterium]|nr:hypothetical protein [Acidimicrobiia bacterium]